MKRIALLLLVAAVAASPAAAASKKKTKKMAAATAEKYDPNEASLRFMKDSLPLWLPSWAVPIYFGIQKQKEAKK
jgi:hypothetical protein